MNEYQDQIEWFELRGYDGFRWEHVADFTTREDAHEYAQLSDVMAAYENWHVRRATGIA